MGLTSNWPITVNMRDIPTGVHTGEMRQEAHLNHKYMLIYAFLRQDYKCNIYTKVYVTTVTLGKIRLKVKF